MKLHFTKRGIRSMLAGLCTAAAVLVALPACSGGGDDEGGATTSSRDISPHDLVPEGATAVELRIIGVHVLYVGWEIGTDPSVDPGIPGAAPDETETPLTMVFMADGATSNTGTMQLALPNASVAYDEGIQPFNGTWYQTPRAGDQPNTVMYINFRAEGDVPHAGGAEPPTHSIATGENICIHLRTVSEGPLGYQFIGAVMSGKLTLEGPFREMNSRDGQHMINPTYDLSSQPCVYTVGGGWTPEDN